MTQPSLLLDRLRAAGIADVVSVERASGGLAAEAGLAHLTDGTTLFVKTFPDPPGDDAFATEAEGLEALRARGGIATPEVIVATRDLLVLESLAPRPQDERFWADFAHALARHHTVTRHDRFGWHRDNWLGRRRQHNAWSDDGFAFFAERRLLRWLEEPKVFAALGQAGRAQLERLCARLPEILPDAPACLVHGDLWAHNVMATADGAAALIDPAVSYTWAEVDLAHLWTTAPPAEAAGFFDLYAELTGLDRAWRERMPVIQLRQHLAVIAQFEPDWGAAEIARETLARF